jgi:hypothetical protein
MALRRLARSLGNERRDVSEGAKRRRKEAAVFRITHRFARTLGLRAFEELFGKAAEKDRLAACAPQSEPIYPGARMKPCRSTFDSFLAPRRFPIIFFTFRHERNYLSQP